MVEDYEGEGCEECGSSNSYDVVYEGRMTKLCSTCAAMNGAVMIKKPTTEQWDRAVRDTPLQERVKAWRKARQEGPKEVTLDTLRRRKEELDRDKQKKQEELIKREIEEAKTVLDFRYAGMAETATSTTTKTPTISDLKRIRERKRQEREVPITQSTRQPIFEPRTEIDSRLEQVQQTELEMDEFIQEVKKTGEEEQLKQEIEVPRPLEPIDPWDYEKTPEDSGKREKEEEDKDSDNNSE